MHFRVPANRLFDFMLEELVTYLSDLDASDADVTDNATITAKLGELAAYYTDAALAWQAQTEQAVLASSKTLEKKVGYQISFTRQDESGSAQEYGWPDTSAYGPREYTYLRGRFTETTNLYLKSQYGFFLYLRDQSKRHEEVAELVDVFFHLSQRYFELAPTADKRKHYALHAVQTIVLAFRLALSRRSHDRTAELLRNIVAFMLDIQRAWDPAQPGTLVLFATLTELMSEHPTPFQAVNDIGSFLEKNREAISVLGTTYRYGAMELAQATAALTARLKLDARPWHLLTAAQYEQLAAEADAQNNSTATVFLDSALRLYREWQEPEAAARVAQLYQQLRTAFPLSQVRTPYPEEASRSIAETIAADVARHSEAELIILIASTPMFASVKAVQENIREQEKMFTDSLPVTVQDKHGNAIQLFSSPEEIERFQLLKTYGLFGQVATQTLVRLMLEAYKAGKLTVNGVVQHLAASWLGEPRPMRDHGRTYQTHPLRLLSSGIRVLFAELDRWQAGETEEPDFIAATDSLVLKIEYILRYICDKLGIVTFRPNPKKDGVVMEKLLDELLRDLEEHLEEDDLFFIKYYLHEKAGQNLRNQVAHGLLDDEEYGVETVFLVLTMILKLANYEFRSPAL